MSQSSMALLQLLIFHGQLCSPEFVYHNPKDSLPDSMSEAALIQRHFARQAENGSFLIHPDCIITPSNAKYLLKISSIFQLFQRMEGTLFIHQDPSVGTNFPINVVENKLRTKNWVGTLNELDKSADTPIKMMDNILIIHSPENDAHRTNGVDEKCKAAFEYLRNANDSDSFIFKPTHSSRNKGVRCLTQTSLSKASDELIYGVFADFFDEDGRGAFITPGTPLCDAWDKAMVVQHRYSEERMEFKVWVLFGNVYYGIILGRDIMITHDKKCIAVEKEQCDRIQKRGILTEELFDEIVRKSELMARHLGVYNLRCDWFVGGKFGLILNEFAFPNNLELKPEIFGETSEVWEIKNKFVTGMFAGQEARYENGFQVRSNKRMFVGFESLQKAEPIDFLDKPVTSERARSPRHIIYN